MIVRRQRSGLSAIIIVLAVVHCTPEQRSIAHEASKDGCALVEAITADGTAQSVCAAADDIQTILAAVMAARGDSGARMAGACKIIPTTTTCATNAETLAGIRAVQGRR